MSLPFLFLARCLINNVVLEYGTTLAYGNYKSIPGSFTGSTSYSLSVNLTGLTSTDLYYYRFRGTNDFGTSYSSGYTFRTIPVGTVFQGGHVYYFDDSGHGTGLIMSENDVAVAAWGCSGTLIGGTSTAFGTGNANTTAIVGGCATVGIAAEVCYNLSLSGYTDWYLPSRDEINNSFFNYAQISTNYWSSSENSSTLAWRVYFDGGGRHEATTVKTATLSVRSVRRF